MKFDVFLVFEEFLAAQRDNLLVWTLIWLGAGTVIYFGLNYQPSYFMMCLPQSGCIFLFAAMMRLNHKHHDKISVLI